MRAWLLALVLAAAPSKGCILDAETIEDDPDDESSIPEGKTDTCVNENVQEQEQSQLAPGESMQVQASISHGPASGTITHEGDTLPGVFCLRSRAGLGRPIVPGLPSMRARTARAREQGNIAEPEEANPPLWVVDGHGPNHSFGRA